MAARGADRQVTSLPGPHSAIAAARRDALPSATGLGRPGYMTRSQKPSSPRGQDDNGDGRAHQLAAPEDPGNALWRYRVGRCAGTQLTFFSADCSGADLGARSIGWRAGAESSPKPDCPVNGALEGIVLNGPLPGGQAERPALIRVSEEGINRLGQGLSVLDRDELARSFKRGAASHAGGHNCGTAGHGLEQDQGHPVVAGR